MSDRIEGQPGPVMRVLMCFDGGGVLPAGVTLRSLALSQRGPVEIVVLGLGLTPDDVVRLTRSAEPLAVEIIHVEPSVLDGLAGEGHLPPAAFLRMLGPRLAGRPGEHLLYVDSDTLVRRAIDPLFATPAEGFAISAVVDPNVPHVSSPAGVRRWRELGLDPRTPMLQSGVLMLDVSLWEAERLRERVLEFARQHQGELNYLDQDAMNAVIAGRFHRLRLKWNQMPSLRMSTHLGYSFFDRDEVEEAVEEPAIMHFAGSIKPWNSLKDRDPGFAVWREIAADTPFAGEVEERLRRIRRPERRLGPGRSRTGRWALDVLRHGTQRLTSTRAV